MLKTNGGNSGLHVVEVKGAVDGGEVVGEVIGGAMDGAEPGMESIWGVGPLNSRWGFGAGKVKLKGWEVGWLVVEGVGLNVKRSAACGRCRDVDWIGIVVEEGPMRLSPAWCGHDGMEGMSGDVERRSGGLEMSAAGLGCMKAEEEKAVGAGWLKRSAACFRCLVVVGLDLKRSAARRRTDDVVGMSDGKVAELAAAWKRLAA